VTVGLVALTALAFWLLIDWGLGNGRASSQDYASWQVIFFVLVLIVLAIAGSALAGMGAAVLGIVPAVVVGFIHEFTKPNGQSANDGLWPVGVGFIGIGTLMGVLVIGSLVAIVKRFLAVRQAVSQEQHHEGES
jgi:hypothetical protein